MRHDYDVAAQKLLGVWQRLPGDERKAEALFHGARARSRADHDDDAIAGYREVVATVSALARSRAEASFLIGWLDFNRGRYTEAIPALEETLDATARSQFDDDARWYLGFSRWLSGDIAGRARRLREARRSIRARSRAARAPTGAARALDKLGRADEAKALARARRRRIRSATTRLQARARLKEHGVELGAVRRRGKRHGAAARRPRRSSWPRDPLISASTSCSRAGLTVEAGFELSAARASSCKRYGAGARAAAALRSLRQGRRFHRPHQLAETLLGRRAALDPQQRRQRRASGGSGLPARLPRPHREVSRRPAITRLITSTRSCRRSRPTTRTTSPTPTRSAFCR